MNVLNRAFFQIQKWSYSEVAFWSLMVGLGESYIVAFALSCGFSEKLAGLLAVLPLALASVFQLLLLQLLPRFRSRKSFVITCATLQMFSLLGVTLCAVMGWTDVFLIFFLNTAYWLFGLASGPPWNVWIVSLLPKDRLSLFFSRRGVVHELALLVGLVAAGYWLQAQSGSSFSFAVLFFAAAVTRILSIICFGFTPPDTKELEKSKPSKLSDVFEWLAQREMIRLMIPLGLFHFGVGIGSPYFVPFLLEQMELPYFTFSWMIAIPILFRAMSYPFHRIAMERFGLAHWLVVNGMAVAFLPSLWALHPSILTMFVLQAVAGTAWAGYEYGIVMVQIQGYPEKERSRILGWSNLITGLSTLFGVAIGFTLMKDFPNANHYSQVFFLSSMARFFPLAALALLVPKSTQKIYGLFIRIVGAQGGRGGLTRPILYVKRENKNPKKTPSR